MEIVLFDTKQIRHIIGKKCVLSEVKMKVERISSVGTCPSFGQAGVVKKLSSKVLLTKGSKIIDELTALATLSMMSAIFVAQKNQTKMQESKDELSYENFEKKLLDAELKEPEDFYSICIEENLIGTGANSRVYKFSHPSLESWVLKVDTKHGGIESNNARSIEKVDEEFAGVNMGQEIARLGKNVTVLKRITGSPHSIENWSVHRSKNAKITSEMSTSFLKSVKKISEFPQETFDDYAKELKVYEDNGYKADSFNPNNFLVDYQAKKIHIIDAYKYDVDANMNTKYDLICPLLDYTNYEQFYQSMSDVQKEEFVDITKAISEKCSIASEKLGIDQSKDKFKEFLSRIDTREGNANNYSARFESMQKICSF